MNLTLANLIFLLAGMLFVSGAIALAVREIRLQQRGAQAIGVICDRHVTSGRDSDCGSLTCVTVTVEYEDCLGTKQRATAPVVTGGGLGWKRGGGPEVKLFGPPDYAVGDSVAILYDPEQPEEIQVDTWMNRWLWALVMGVMAAAFLGAGLVL
jgi:Protein of unknown function (DUF3592)